MLSIEKNGYKLPSGKIITSMNLENLSGEEIKELIATPMTAFEYMGLRKQTHDLIDRIQSNNTNTENMFGDLKIELKEINKKLEVTTNNGEEKIRPLNEVVGEMYERESGLRKRNKFYDAVSENKTLVIAIVFFIITVIITTDYLVFKNYNVLDKIPSEWKFTIIPAGIVAPLVVWMIKKFFSK